MRDGLQKVDLNLQGRIRELAQNLGFCFDFQGHQIQDEHTQWTNSKTSVAGKASGMRIGISAPLLITIHSCVDVTATTIVRASARAFYVRQPIYSQL